MTDPEEMRQRRELINDYVANGGDREHLEALTPAQFRRLVAVDLLTRADQMRELAPDIAEDALRESAEIMGLADSRGLRRITLSNGQGVLVDADDPHSEEEIRAALEADK